MSKDVLLKAFILLLLLVAPIFCIGQALWGKTPAERNVLKHLRDIVSYTQYLRQEDEDSLTLAETTLLDSITRKADDILTQMPQCFQAAWKLAPPDGSEEHRKAMDNYDQILLWFDSAMLVLNSPRDLHLFNRISDTLCKTLTFIGGDARLRFLANLSGRELVTVDVKVMDAVGVEQPGYNVFVKPYISSDPSLIIAFSPTNMASKDISTGWKLCWIEKDDQRLQQRDWQVKIDDPSTHHLVFVLKH